MGLDDEDVTAPDGDVVLAVDLAVGELAQVGLAQFDAEMPGDVLRQFRVGTARNQLEPAMRDELHRAQRYCLGSGAVSGPVTPRAASITVCGGTTAPSGTSAPGRTTQKGPNSAPWPMIAAVARALRHRGPPADGGVRQDAVRADLAALADDATTPQDHTREERDIGRQLDLGVDVGALGVPHGHAATHPALVDPIAQLGFGHRQLRPVVHAGGLHRIGQDQRLHPVPRAEEHAHRVGQVVLALRIGGGQPAQGRRQDAPTKAVDGCVDLGDGLLLIGGVGFFDHLAHARRPCRAPPVRSPAGPAPRP